MAQRFSGLLLRGLRTVCGTECPVANGLLQLKHILFILALMRRESDGIAIRTNVRRSTEIWPGVYEPPPE